MDLVRALGVRAPSNDAYHHGTILLIPDRLSSPAGERELRDRRCQGAASDGPWPHPGLFSVPELAATILVERERLAQRTIRRPATTAPLYAARALVEHFPVKELQPGEAHQLADAAVKKILSLGLSNDDLAALARDIEERAASESLELKPFSELVVAALVLRARAEADGVKLSDWDDVERATHELLQPNDWTHTAWERVFSREPGRAARFEILVPATMDPLPLEERFLKALARHLDVTMLEPPAAADFATTTEARECLESLPRALPDTASISHSSLHWAVPSSALPSAAEAAEMIPGDDLLDVAEPAPSKRTPLLTALHVFADWLDRDTPRGHAFERDPIHAARLREAGLDPTLKPDLSTFWSDVASFATLPLGAAPVRGRRATWLRLLIEAGAFESSTNAALPTHPRLSPLGWPLWPLPFVGLAGRRAFLWGTPAELAPHLVPTSPETLKSRPYPSSVVAFLASLGLTAPDVSREARNLAASLRALQPTWLAHTTERLVEPQTPPQNTATRARLVSPSGVEAYLDCPSRYHLERVLRIQGSDENEGLAEDHALLGSWIHAVLDDFFAAPAWENSLATIRALFEARLPEFAGAHASGAYLDVLRGRGESLARRLAWHIDHFEKPLRAWVPRSGELREKSVSGDLGGLHLRGRLDRIDPLPGGRAFLWDYKSGRTDTKSLKSQLAKGKVQQLIYRALVEQDDVARLVGLEGATRIVGGGYLNPLEPSRSALFVVSGIDSAIDAAADVWERTGHPVERVPVEAWERAAAELVTILADVAHRMEAGDFAPAPSSNTSCRFCAAVSVCGRPYLIAEDAGGTP